MRSLIEKVAVAKTTVSFSRLFDLFDQGTPSADVYDTLEAACAQLADWEAAISSVLMAMGQTGLPGDGFFDISRTHRISADYKRIAGSTHLHGLTYEQRVQMVQLERPVVYAHAKV